MNREIKFRGKRIDNDEWVFGYYFKDKENHFIYLIKPIDRGNGIKTVSVRIIPETIGQYIGLKDINGVEIYECDIVRYNNNNWVIQYMIDGDTSAGFYCILGNSTTFYCWDKTMSKRCKVIGNIHEAKK